MKITYLRVGVSALVMCGTVIATAGIASADATDEYPIPNWMLKTSCTAEQIVAAARDVEPVCYYERYMIGYNNHSPEIQQATQDQMHWFFSMDYAGRRAYSEELATNFADPLTVAWPKHQKLFLNNKGVAAPHHRRLHPIPASRLIRLELVTIKPCHPARRFAHGHQ
jgi:Domain of unknown function (DUF5078)